MRKTYWIAATDRPNRLPQSIPLPIRVVASQIKMRRINVLFAPSALRIPIIGIASRIRMINPETILNPDTASIRMMITHTFISSRSNQ